jgi:hypothetical protein
MQRLLHWISNYRIILLLFAATALVASAQSLFLGQKKYLAGGIEYNTYNNYTIFKQSFFHLVDEKDIYFPYPLEHWDIYKYSPTFALLFGVFAVLPDAIGLTLWNLLNALILVLAVYYLPRLTAKQKGLILLACVIESMTAIQNEQSNGLMAGLIILAFGLCERQRLFLAALCLVITVYIKIFGFVAFSLFLFYPGKIKMALYTLFWMIVLFVMPLIAIDFYQLKFLYKSWGVMLSQDHSVSQGLSVMGWLESWFSIKANKLWLAFSGAILFLIPFVKINRYKNYGFRLLGLCSVLIWIVIFNHKAESPTFIIAMAGASLWYFMRRRGIVDTLLFLCAILLTTLSPTDLFPPVIRKSLIEPYVLKAVPCILIWGKIIFEMMWSANTTLPDTLETSQT